LISEGPIERVATGVWVGRPAPEEGLMGAVVDRGEGVIVDTTAYGLFAARFVRQVESVEGRVRWRFVLVSHRHFDHWGAAGVVAAPVVTHRLTAAALATYDIDWLTKNIKNWTAARKLRPELLGVVGPVAPGLVFSDRVSVPLGGLSVDLIHTGGHTEDLSIISIPALKVVFASDNVFEGKPAYTGDGDLNVWIAALGAMAALSPEIVVPGHGRPGGPELIHAQRAALSAQLDQTLQATP
jgi:glyoxylase-like metal-dependent hydrolase (beta-lactamase superfamily II)